MNENRGMFGYEGEGFMRGGYSRARDDYDFRDDYNRTREESYRGRGPKNYQRSDERIREDVCELLTDDDYVDATEVEVNVGAGIVTLSGEVADRNQKRRAEDLVERIAGVREVQNNLRIAG